MLSRVAMGAPTTVVSVSCLLLGPPPPSFILGNEVIDVRDLVGEELAKVLVPLPNCKILDELFSCIVVVL